MLLPEPFHSKAMLSFEFLVPLLPDSIPMPLLEVTRALKSPQLNQVPTMPFIHLPLLLSQGLAALATKTTNIWTLWAARATQTTKTWTLWAARATRPWVS